MAAPYLEAALSRLRFASGLHSQPLIFGWLRPIGLAFAAAHLFDGCALSGLHSLMLRPIGLALRAQPLILSEAAKYSFDESI